MERLPEGIKTENENKGGKKEIILNDMEDIIKTLEITAVTNNVVTKRINKTT